MSAPSTNVKKQKSRHQVPLWGIGAAVVFATLLFAGYVLFLAEEGNEPGQAGMLQSPAVQTE